MNPARRTLLLAALLVGRSLYASTVELTVAPGGPLTLAGLRQALDAIPVARRQEGVLVTSRPGLHANAAEFVFGQPPNTSLDRAVPGLKPIPFAKIGLQADEHRTQVAPRDMRQLREFNTTMPSFSSTTDIDASNMHPRP